MKFCKLFNNFLPQKKCGVDPVTAGLVGTGVSSALGLAGDIASNDQSAANVQMQLAAQREENQKNRDWQTEQAEISRQFTTSERQAQQAYQTSERSAIAAENLRQSERMAEVNAMYNSPVYQVKQLQKAGINPNVYFGRNASFAGSNQSALAGASSSAPFGPSPHGVGSVAGLSPVAFQPLHLRVPELQQSLASLIEAGSKAKTAPAQIKALLSQALNNEQDAKYKELLSDYQAIANDLFKANFPRNIEKSIIEVEILRQNKLNAEKQGKVFDSQEELNRAEARLKKSMDKLTGEQAWQAAYMNSRIDEWYTNAQNEVRSRIKANEASASESSAMAATENMLRDMRRDLMSYDVFEREATTITKVNTMLEELYSKRELAKAQYNEAKRRASMLEHYLKARQKSKFFSGVDDFFGWLSGHIGVSLSGNVSSSSSSVTKE